LRDSGEGGSPPRGLFVRAREGPLRILVVAEAPYACCGQSAPPRQTFSALLRSCLDGFYLFAPRHKVAISVPEHFHDIDPVIDTALLAIALIGAPHELLE